MVSWAYLEEKLIRGSGTREAVEGVEVGVECRATGQEVEFEVRDRSRRVWRDRRR